VFASFCGLDFAGCVVLEWAERQWVVQFEDCILMAVYL
jgi:hypothetical protein